MSLARDEGSTDTRRDNRLLPTVVKGTAMTGHDDSGDTIDGLNDLVTMLLSRFFINDFRVRVRVQVSNEQRVPEAYSGNGFEPAVYKNHTCCTGFEDGGFKPKAFTRCYNHPHHDCFDGKIR